MCQAGRAVALAAALAATAFNANAQDGDVAAGHAFARSLQGLPYGRAGRGLAENNRYRTGAPRYCGHPRDDSDRP